jgi:hypothetical protein
MFLDVPFLSSFRLRHSVFAIRSSFPYPIHSIVVTIISIRVSSVAIRFLSSPFIVDSRVRLLFRSVLSVVFVRAHILRVSYLRSSLRLRLRHHQVRPLVFLRSGHLLGHSWRCS